MILCKQKFQLLHQQIKAPKGIDLIIHSRPLTKEEEHGISEYIKNYKLKGSKNT